MTRAIDGLSEIIDAFDGVLIDQYGVLHDGNAPFDGALECLSQLSERGLPIVAITNSGRRADPNIARLERLGFPCTLFRGLVSSGELAHDDVRRRLESGALSPGAEIAVFLRQGNVSALEGLNLRLGPPSPRSELLAILGAEPENTPRNAYRQAMEPLARRGVEAHCANPDTLMYSADGGVSFAPGAIAEDYAALGGEVTLFGKPARPIFNRGIQLVGASPERILMIGDSPAHDIAGASAAGCRTLLLTEGVQADLASEIAPADYAAPRLRW